MKGEGVMLNKITGKDRRTNLEREIDRVLAVMAEIPPNSNGYKELLEQLEVLYKASANDRNRRVSPDTVALIAANLVGIVLILGYEHGHVVTSKALGFVIRGRV